MRRIIVCMLMGLCFASKPILAGGDEPNRATISTQPQPQPQPQPETRQPYGAESQSRSNSNESGNCLKSLALIFCCPVACCLKCGEYTADSATCCCCTDLWYCLCGGEIIDEAYGMKTKPKGGCCFCCCGD